jgi:hypothetical protein
MGWWQRCTSTTSRRLLLLHPFAHIPTFLVSSCLGIVNSQVKQSPGRCLGLLVLVLLMASSFLESKSWSSDPPRTTQILDFDLHTFRVRVRVRENAGGASCHEVGCLVPVLFFLASPCLATPFFACFVLSRVILSWRFWSCLEFVLCYVVLPRLAPLCLVSSRLDVSCAILRLSCLGGGAR